MDNIAIEIDNLIDNLFDDDLNKTFIKSLIISRLKEIDLLWNKYKMYENIKNHSTVVAILSIYFLLNFKDKTNNYYITLKNYLKYNNLKKISLFLIDSALLHDIGKVIELNRLDDKSHSEIGYEILIKEGKLIEANACKNHLIDSFINRELPLIPFLVNLADKHVQHEKVVSIKNRFSDLKNRYPSFMNMFTDNIIEIYEKSVTIFYTEKLNKVINFYNLL